MSAHSNEEIADMTYRQLQDACKSAGLSAGGPGTTLRSRLRIVNTTGIGNCNNKNENDVDVEDDRDGPDKEDGQPPPKRHKGITDDLICAITQELPFDPVTAEDGRIYERAAIELHFKGRSDAQQVIRSPITNEAIGNRLFPAVQQKNLIQSLIDNAVIIGSLADAWNEKVQQKKYTDKLMKDAEAGNADVMQRLGVCYKKGYKGLKKDTLLALSWFRKAHAAGSIEGTACLGELLITRYEGQQFTQGVMYLSIAAARGSDLAACTLGWMLLPGRSTKIISNRVEAMQWLKTSLSDTCGIKHMKRKSRAEVRGLLQQLGEDVENSDDEI